MMKPGTQYIVTKASDDGTFELGDHITLATDGRILCKEAEGWIEPSDVPAACAGMTAEVDAQWFAKEVGKALALLGSMGYEIVQSRSVSNLAAINPPQAFEAITFDDLIDANGHASAGGAA